MLSKKVTKSKIGSKGFNITNFFFFFSTHQIGHRFGGCGHRFNRCDGLGKLGGFDGLGEFGRFDEFSGFGGFGGFVI